MGVIEHPDFLPSRGLLAGNALAAFLLIALILVGVLAPVIYEAQEPLIVEFSVSPDSVTASGGEQVSVTVSWRLTRGGEVSDESVRVVAEKPVLENPNSPGFSDFYIDIPEFTISGTGERSLTIIVANGVEGTFHFAFKANVEGQEETLAYLRITVSNKFSARMTLEKDRVHLKYMVIDYLKDPYGEPLKFWETEDVGIRVELETPATRGSVLVAEYPEDIWVSGPFGMTLYSEDSNYTLRLSSRPGNPGEYEVVLTLQRTVFTYEFDPISGVYEVVGSKTINIASRTLYVEVELLDPPSFVRTARARILGYSIDVSSDNMYVYFKGTLRLDVEIVEAHLRTINSPYINPSEPYVFTEILMYYCLEGVVCGSQKFSTENRLRGSPRHS